jgi:hypothetical protein
MESNEGQGDLSGAPIAPGEAVSAIAAIDGTRSWLAGRVIAPVWYHPAFGLLAGGAIAEAEVRNWTLFAWSVAAYTVGCGVLSWLNQRRVGVALKYFDRCTRAIYTGQVLALGTLIALACWLGLGRGVHGAFIVAGVLAVPVTVAFGRWTDQVLRSRLQGAR